LGPGKLLHLLAVAVEVLELLVQTTQEQTQVTVETGSPTRLQVHQ
jgi:hypothetical protein